MHARTDIVVLCHNQLSITKGFVDKIFAATDNFQLIFIDNASSDGTNDFLLAGEKENRWKLITSTSNLGVIGGRNLGAKYVESQFFMNIDNDQYPQSGWLQGLHDLMETGYDIVGPEAWQIYPPRTPGVVNMGKTSMADRGYFPFKHCSRPTDKFSYIGCGGMLIKKKVYNTIGLFDERYNPAFFEDPDFCWRALKAGFKLGWKHDCPIVHLAHQTFDNQNLFQKNTQFVQSWLKFREKWENYYPDLMSMT